MPKVAYSEEERQQIRETLIATGLELFAKQGIQHTTVEQIYRRAGISRTFFYSFFPAKEDLVVQCFYRQQPKIVAHARRLMDDPGFSWRDGVKQFFRDCCYGQQSPYAIMSVEEQQVIFKHLSKANYQACQERQVKMFSAILDAFGLQADEATAKLFCNLGLSIVILRKAIPHTLPFLFSESAEAMVDFQIEALVDYLETLREQQSRTQITMQEEANDGNFQ